MLRRVEVVRSQSGYKKSDKSDVHSVLMLVLSKKDLGSVFSSVSFNSPHPLSPCLVYPAPLALAYSNRNTK